MVYVNGCQHDFALHVKGDVVIFAEKIFAGVFFSQELFFADREKIRKSQKSLRTRKNLVPHGTLFLWVILFFPAENPIRIQDNF